MDAEDARQDANNQRATAESNAAEAQRQARRAQAENLATKAQSLMQRNNAADDRALILARDAVNTTWLSPEHYVAPMPTLRCVPLSPALTGA